MKTRKSLSVVGMVMAAVFVLGLGIANANIIPTETGITPLGPNFTWTYDVNLSAGERAVTGPAPTGSSVVSGSTTTGTFFTIYDFAGYVTGSAAGPAGWIASTQFLGFTPSGSNPLAGDSASIVNITWTYTTGPTPFPNTLTGPLDLGNFTAVSSEGIAQTTTSYTSRSINDFNGTLDDNTGSTKGPTVPSGVPEPGTLLLLGFGLVGAAGFRRKFKK